MKIVLVHRNFPGQFRHLAPALIRMGHEVRALTWKGNQNPRSVPTLEYQVEDIDANGPIADFARHHANGQAAAQVCAAQTARDGFVPDLVVGSINWGETLYLRDVWPDARHVGYAEFCYNPRGLDTDFDPEFSQTSLERDTRVVARTAHLVLGATRCDRLISPTKWQASTFPAEMQGKIDVVHDGVATEALTPDDSATSTLPNRQVLGAKDEVITFVNRNLEPYRGYHTFMRALPDILRRRPNAQVVIVGGTGRGYGPIPARDVTWKDYMTREVGSQIDPRRVHYTGQVPYGDLLSLLRISSAHVYLSYPFVLSWSMLEAMALGCLVIGSDTPPVAEAIEHGKTGLLVDFFDHQAWADTIVNVLEQPEDYAHLRAAARAHIVETYDLQSRCLPKLLDVLGVTD